MRRLRLSSFALPALLAGSVGAQCNPGWDARFAYPGTQSPLFTLTAFDDGSGPGLFVGGTFGIAGGLPAANIARYDGTNWSALSGGTSGIVISTAVWDDGTGPALYAGGAFATAGGGAAPSLARWSGSSWNAAGSGLPGDVRALGVFDDGLGPKLVAGVGMPSGMYRVTMNIGGQWFPLGGDFNGIVFAFAVHDEGAGPRLFAGGTFTMSGTTSVNGVARWDGSTWTALGPGTSPGVNALAVFDEGAGPRLFAGGNFQMAGGQSRRAIARWDGASWSSVGTGAASIGAQVNALKVWDDGTGPALYAGGNFSSLSGTTLGSIARWNGSSWSPLGTGGDFNAASRLAALEVFDDGSGPALFAAGEFNSVENLFADRIARWDGTKWSALGDGLDGQVEALARCDVGGVDVVYAAGHFRHAGGPPAAGIARLDASGWSTLGTGFPFNGAYELIGFDAGSGTELYASGEFTSVGGITTSGIARWNGSAWSSVGGGMSGSPVSVRALAVHDDGGGSALYAGGAFTDAGGVPAANIARWDGSAWSALGTGLTGTVEALCTYDDGTGAALYACGGITAAGGVSAQGIARWNGTSWSVLPGPGLGLLALAVHDLGAGPRLVAAGGFTQIGGVPVDNVAAWDGTTWSAVGAGLSGLVRALHGFDDGCGAALFAGGTFALSSGGPQVNVARFQAGAWSPLAGVVGSNTPGGASVRAFAVFDDGVDGASDLYVGGSFLYTGEFGAGSIAQWHGTPGSATTFCAGDGSAGACPCGNAGAVGHGCASSVQAGGARLAAQIASGFAHVGNDTVVLLGTDMPAQSPVLYFQGTQRVNGGAGVAFGDGLRCAGGAIVRLGQKTSVGGTSQYPAAGDAPISLRGMLPGSGGTRTYQGWYRNAASFCTSATFNLTNGVEIVWQP